MSVLLLRLAGPMQSWGTRSRFAVRDTEREPSKSGVVGLLAAALGRRRTEPLDDLAALRMGVRVEREGEVAKEFQTALDVARASGTGLKDCEPSTRYYLADACFLVGLAGDQELLARLDAKLGDPVWPLFLGRKSYVPTLPVRVGVTEGPLEAVLRAHPLPENCRPTEPVRFVIDCGPDEGEPRQDMPFSFATREFGLRYVRHEFVSSPEVGR